MEGDDMATIGDICNREVIVTDGSATVAAAAQLMHHHHVGSLVVVAAGDGGTRKPVGIITDRDMIMEVMALDRNPHEVKVSEVMTSKLTTARDTDDVPRTLQLMRDQGVRRVPIVNARGELVGIVATDDLLRVLSDEMATLAGIAVRELSHEASAQNAYYA
jgi:CBS domain-containing protein